MDRWCPKSPDAHHSTIQGEHKGRAAYICLYCKQADILESWSEKALRESAVIYSDTFQILLEDELLATIPPSIGIEQAEELYTWLQNHLLPKLREQDRQAFLAKRGEAR